jgi:catechol 2,3-dioxygenase-like lactoylglutathione lyase family enzyme
MKIRGVDFVMFQVSDLARAARFYRETLGLPQEIYREDYQWAEFNCGNLTLALKAGEVLPDVIAGGRLALAVDDIQAAQAELRAAGVRVLGEPADHGCCWHLDVLDPDRNRIILHRRTDGTFGQHSPHA